MRTLFYALKQTALTLILLVVVFAPFEQLVSTAHAQKSDVTAPLTGGVVDSRTSYAPTGGDLGCSVSDLSLCVSGFVYIFTVGIGSAFAYVSAYFFSFAIQLSLNSTAYGLNFVSQGWTTARDLANMAFLFILIYIAFKIMLEAETSDTVSMLTWVIAIALVVNFSFFATRIVIDAGNILAIQFYNAIQAPSIGSTAAGSQGKVPAAVPYLSTLITPEAANVKDLTASIMGALQLQNLFSSTSFQRFQTQQGFLVKVIATSFLYIAAAIMLWMLTVAFAVNGVKFIVRIVVLWFLIIASPLAFVARAVPKFEGYYHEWQSKLITHAFYPVVFMFIFLILTNFANQMACGGAAAGVSCNGLLGDIFGGMNATSPDANFVAIMGLAIANVAIRMGFVIAILWIGLEASNRIGVMGAKQAEGFGKWIGGAYKGAYKYGPGWAAGAAYRQTGGRFANYVDKKVAGSQWANRTGTLGGVVGYRLRHNVLAPAKATSLGTVASSFKERESFLKDRKTEMTSQARDIENKEKISEISKLISENETNGRPLDTGVSGDDKRRIENLSKRELDAISVEQIQKIASLLTEDQIKRVSEMEKITDQDKDKIRQMWHQTSKNAPVQKTDTGINELAALHGKFSAQIPEIIHAANTGTLIDKKLISTIQENIEEKHDAIKTDLETARGQLMYAIANPKSDEEAQEMIVQAAKAALTKTETESRNLNKALKKIEHIEESRKKIQPNTGGTSQSGEFIKK